MTEYNIFLDTCCIIYALENPSELGNKARRLIQEYASKAYHIYISPVTIMEYTTQDFQQNKERLEAFIADNDIQIIPIIKDMGYISGELRSNSSIRAMDSLQLAVAQSLSPVMFITNDIKLEQFTNNTMQIKIIEKS